jgi:hypothetical protein
MMRPTIAIIASAVWGALLIPGLLGAALSTMFFDAPGSMNNPVAWINAGIVVSFPLLCLVAIAGSWVVWSARRNREASKASAVTSVAVASLPLLPVAYVVVAMAIETIGVIASGQPMGLHSTIISH